MKIIVGLGNPGSQYERTRHNVGFRVADELARRWSLGRFRAKFSGLAVDGPGPDGRLMLLKPTTFMNLSGKAVREAAGFHKVAVEDLLVLCDDMALPLGRIRIRKQGSAGGHNGLTSVIQELGSDGFARLRMGIGQVSGERMVGHVLGTFAAEEEPIVREMIRQAADAAECWLTRGADEAMTRFNAKPGQGSGDRPGPEA